VSFLPHFNVEKYRDMKSRSSVSRGHWKWYHSTDWAWFPIRVL